jgi:hypothetical protein
VRCLLALACSSFLACQAVSGLDRLRFAVGDGGTSQMRSDVEGEDDAGSACPKGSSLGCLRSCDFAADTLCGTGMRCARLEEPAGDYCVTPSEQCETDGRCDEPEWGTRRCAAGSDAVDCACSPKLAAASCDLVAQCGCAPGTHCTLRAVREGRASVGCTPNLEPVRAPADACNAETECPAGYSCWRELCEKYCAADSDCDGGQCMALRDPAEVSGVRVCSVACDFDTDGGCRSGARCVRAPSGEAYCLVPREPCPFENDDVCDEPQGSRICVAGSDAHDCS